MARSSATVSAWRAQAPGANAASNNTETLVRRMETSGEGLQQE